MLSSGAARGAEAAWTREGGQLELNSNSHHLRKMADLVDLQTLKHPHCLMAVVEAVRALANVGTLPTSIGGGTVWDKGGGHRLKEPNLGYPPNPVFSSDLGHLFFVEALTVDTVNIFFK